jgi:hypothetical protein
VEFIKEGNLFLIEVYCHLHFGIEKVDEITEVGEKVS